MYIAKPIDELTIDDLKKHPIWEWALDQEENEDETWVKPSDTNNFTEELNGSIISGKLTLTNGKSFSMMCEMELKEKEVVINCIIFYDHIDNEYYALEDKVKNLKMPLTFNINLVIKGEARDLLFTVDKVAIYKNNIKTCIE